MLDFNADRLPRAKSFQSSDTCCPGLSTLTLCMLALADSSMMQELCGQRPVDAPLEQCAPPCDGEDGADLWGMLGEAVRECGRGVESRDEALVERMLR